MLVVLGRFRLGNIDMKSRQQGGILVLWNMCTNWGLFDNYVESFQCWGPFRTVAVSLMWGEGAVSDWVFFGLRTFQYGGISLVALDCFSLMVQVVIYVTRLHKRRKLLNSMGVGFCKHIGDQYIFNIRSPKIIRGGRAPVSLRFRRLCFGSAVGPIHSKSSIYVGPGVCQLRYWGIFYLGLGSSHLGLCPFAFSPFLFDTF